MKSIKLKINTKTQKYSIIIGSNLGTNVSKILKENSINFKKCLLIIDRNISKQFISKIKKSLNKKNIYVHLFKANEINKNFSSVNKMIRKEVLKNHISFWLNWNSEILLNRIKNSKKRPLAINLTENELIDLIKKRSNIYSKALYEIKCDKISKSEIVQKVLKNYEVH